MIIIDLDPSQAAFFALCNGNFTTISFMNQSGVFDITSGNAILSFDKKGLLRTIKRELFSYPQADFDVIREE